MFEGCKNLEDLDVSNFDTSNVIDMGNMFYGCSKLKEIKDYIEQTFPSKLTSFPPT